MNDFLIFSKRLKLAEKINAYLMENSILMDAYSVVTALSSLGLLDVEACRKYIEATNNQMIKHSKED